MEASNQFYPANFHSQSSAVLSPPTYFTNTAGSNWSLPAPPYYYPVQSSVYCGQTNGNWNNWAASPDVVGNCNFVVPLFHQNSPRVAAPAQDTTWHHPVQQHTYLNDHDYWSPPNYNDYNRINNTWILQDCAKPKDSAFKYDDLDVVPVFEFIPKKQSLNIQTTKNISYSNVVISKNKNIKSGLIPVKKMAMLTLPTITKPQKTSVKSPLNKFVPQILTKDQQEMLPVKVEAVSDTEVLSSKYSREEKKLLFSCMVCSEPIATRNSLITHVKSHRQPFCICCFALLKSKDHLKAHMKQAHPTYKVLMTSKYGRCRHVLQSLATSEHKKIQE